MISLVKTKYGKHRHQSESSKKRYSVGLKEHRFTAGKMKEIEAVDGEIRVFAGGKTVINAYEADIPNANIIRVPAVLVQSRGVIDAVYYDKPFTFKEAASGMGSLPQISLPVTENFQIPVPPLPVQEEIVRILDKFTELTAELTKRKQQYQYHSKKLLNIESSQRKYFS